MKLSIITLNYKTPDKTLACVDSVYSQYPSLFESAEMECIIVDNNSADGSVDIIKKGLQERKYQHISLVANSENAGFGGGCNLGAKHADGEYFLFLNSDTTVSDKTFLAMMTFLDMHKKVGILGPQLQNPDGSRQPSAHAFYLPFQLLLMLIGMQRFGFIASRISTPTCVDWVSGGALMIRKTLFADLSGFDMHIFMYIEDMEICFRAKKKGFLTYYFPQSHVIHALHGSSSRTFAILGIYKGILYFYKKHQSKTAYVYARILLWSKAKILYIIGSVTGNLYLRDTYGKALEIF